MTEAADITQWIRPSRLFNKGRLHIGAVLGVLNGRIQIFTEDIQIKEAHQVINFEGIISPGLVDLQVNGGGGVLLNETPTKEAIWDIAKAHRKYGTTGILPTVITDSVSVLSRAVDAVMEAVGQNGILGMHIEGPHISVERRGTHKAEFVRPLDEDTIRLVERLRSAHVPTMLTLAPDVVSPEDISRLVDLGTVVSIGHSKASADVVRRALEAGASCFTHLFNAMPPMAGREPGVVGAAINSHAFAGIICDGIHVADEMVAMAIRARPISDRMYLVSDAMPTVGGPTEFNLYGSKVALINNRLVNSEGGLAGAHTTQNEGVKRLVDRIGISAEDALKMAITVPGNAMGLELDQLQGRSIKDIICLTDGLEYQGSLADLLQLPGKNE
ncbi:MAG: N-acetylglucosamine-6-phosphate deacetylase [Alphaproteobacteria bacterium]